MGQPPRVPIAVVAILLASHAPRCYAWSMANQLVIIPMASERNRMTLSFVLRWALCIPRAAAWLLGACLSAVVFGFVTGWKDAA